MDSFEVIKNAADVVCGECVCANLDMCDNCPVRRTINHLNSENSGHYKPELEEALMDLIHKEGPKGINLFAADINLSVNISGVEREIESVWYCDDDDRIYLHISCPEFEGDIRHDSLPNDVQSKLRDDILKYL